MIDTVLIPLLVCGTLGLLVGSFLNVVIHRMPKMMERQWENECAELSGKDVVKKPPFNLMTPRSGCPHCHHAIRWYENIPIFSFLFLKGRCSSCAARISWRYPLIELTTAILFAWCGHRWGLTAQSAAWCVFCACILTLAAIDWDTTLLPDDITLPLLWMGLCVSALDMSGIGLESALWGAVAGYGSLWMVYWGFKLATGKEGMGYGDFKLFAALGAWFGWQALVPIILMASVIGALVGIGMKLSSGLREGGYVPFGPFLGLAGLTALMVSPDRMLGLIGL